MEKFQSEYALASVQDLLSRFNSLVIAEASQVVFFDTEDELKRLERKLLKAQIMLNSFQVGTSKQEQQWAGDVTRVCYDAEDLVDELMLGLEPSNTSILDKIFSYTRGSIMSRKIQQLQDKMDEILSGFDMLNKTKQCNLNECVHRMVPILNPEQKLYGRDEDKEKIITLLLEETIKSVSIVGMGGLGKTTLALNVQQDSRIKDKFDHIIWVSVSAKYDLSKIGSSILHPSQVNETSFLSAERIQSLFHQLRVGRSVLIVLDDLWDVKFIDWATFCTLFLPSPGCKVLFTTHNPKVASVTKATPYYLELMRDEDCQALIVERALSHNRSLSDRQRVKMGEIAAEMAIKCKGLPLAAYILGQFLSSKSCEDDWRSLSERDIYDLKVYKEEIFPAFRLHNTDFGSHLKRCLAYCSLFPHNYDFDRDNLVQLWVAEGFILPQGRSGLKEIGCDYFDELYWRSIFQPSNVGNGDHEVHTYRMHDFIHRFAEFVSSDICFRLEEGNRSLSVAWYKKARHLSLLCHSVQLFLKDIEKCGGLRTFLLPSEHGTEVGKVPYSLFEKLGQLRVLDLSDTDVDELPESLGRLHHLRYLDLSLSLIQMLPESTSNLLGLQVLKLRECYELLELPKNIKNLTNLQHLEVDIRRLRGKPASLGNLTHLQILPVFIVGKSEGYCISELKNLKFLRGTISLADLKNVKDGAEAKEAMLFDKPFIKRLELEGSRSSNGSLSMDVLAGLQPHKNLAELEVSNYSGSSFPSWLTSPSCTLVSIHVQNCQQFDFLPSLGQLPWLKTLHMQDVSVKSMDYHFCGEEINGGAFRSLESLKIKDFRYLESWDRLPGNSMLKLCDLAIEDCPKLYSMQPLTHMNLLQMLEINRCPALESLPQLPTSIKSLIVIQSDMVKRRCQPDGPEWDMIKEIQTVEIDYITVAVPGDPN